jgi:hypothetical protein
MITVYWKYATFLVGEIEYKGELIFMYIFINLFVVYLAWSFTLKEKSLDWGFWEQGPKENI